MISIIISTIIIIIIILLYDYFYMVEYSTVWYIKPVLFYGASTLDLPMYLFSWPGVLKGSLGVLLYEAL